jgi:uncharacterized membrane protein YgdD (TMEM256/DUF423 family)
MQPDVRRLRLSAFTGFLAVLFGAMGAHGPLHEKLKATGQLEHWETALRYHLPHAVLLLVIALLAGGSKTLRRAWSLLFAGIILFSGSLYLLAFTGVKWLGAITPLGGVSFMIGWLMLAFVAREK